MRGLGVQPFKKGPDYIDPMWLGLAGQRPCYNLDFNTQSHDEIAATFCTRATGADVALIEGNMGLHDGVDVGGADTSAALAGLLQAPVILVIDCEGMARGIAPLVLGFQNFDPNVTIGGVVLNRLASARQEGKIVAALERYTTVPVLGAIRRSRDLSILERHIGLTTPGETAAQDETIARLGEVVAQSVDLDRLLEIAASAPPLPSPAVVSCSASRTAAAPQRAITIAVARDEAFGFYYADDFDALQKAGATIVPFSPLHDAEIPSADALFIGGGFPETHAPQLAANATMRASIRQAADAGMPIYAECGGLMYLARSIRWDGATHAMCGVIDGDVIMHKRPQGSGLVMLEQTAAFPWPGDGENHSTAPVRAHEFHHAEIINLPADTRFAWAMRRGHGVDGKHDGIVSRNVLASFSHLRDTSFHHWCSRFIRFVESRMSVHSNANETPNAKPFIDPVNSREATI